MFAEAQEKGALDAWSADLALLAACVAEQQLAAFLQHPSLTAQQQAQTLIDVCGDKLNEAAKNLVAVLAENKRLLLVAEICVVRRDESPAAEYRGCGGNFRPAAD